jgi:hypothetical protein
MAKVELSAHTGRAASLPTLPRADIASADSSDRDGRKPDLRTPSAYTSGPLGPSGDLL